MTATPVIWLPATTVNATTAGTQSNPRITQLANGNILVTWDSTDNTGAGSNAGLDVIGLLFNPLGEPIGTEFLVNQGVGTQDEREADIAALPDGGFLSVFERFIDLSGDQFTDIRLTRHDAGGTVTDMQTPFFDSAPNGAPTGLDPAVAVSSATSALVVWTETETNGESRVVGRIYNPTTLVMGAEISVSNVAGTYGPSAVAVLGTGNYVIVSTMITTSGDHRVNYRLLNAAGGNALGVAPVTETANDATAETRAAVTALTGGGFVIGWSEALPGVGGGQQLLFQRYDNDGIAQGSTGFVLSFLGGADDIAPVVVALPDGGFLALGDNANSLTGRRFDALGAPVGDSFVLASGASAGSLDAVMLADGRVAVSFVTGAGEIGMTILDSRDGANADGVYAPQGWQVGTTGNDTIVADPDGGVVAGHDGNDTIDTGNAADTVFGGEGDDTIRTMGAGEGDTLFGGAGNDRFVLSNSFYTGAVHGGEGEGDHFDFSAYDGFFITIDLAAGTYSDTGATFDVSGIEIVSGGNGNDTITGDASANTLSGGDGADTLSGGGGIDRIIAGADGLNGDAYHGGGQSFFDRSDRIDWSASTASGVTFNMGSGTATDGTTTEAMTGFAELIGTAQADVIIGGSHDFHLIDGGGGNDAITGGAGNDVLLRGGAGNDTITGAAQNYRASLFGGIGNDTITYLGREGAVHGDEGDDTITGAAEENSLFGGDGDDVFQSTGNGSLLTSFGGADNDRFVLSDINVLGAVHGDAGTADHLDGSLLVTIALFANLDLGVYQLDPTPFDLTGIENVTGGALADTITGDGAANTLVGNGGADSIEGGAGEDLITGGDGNDTLRGGGDADVIFGGDNDDFLHGNDGDDQLTGSDGNDFLFGGAGFNSLFGGEGDDSLFGGDDDDLLDGGLNDDSLNGNAGADTLRGGNGRDTLIGGDGNDSLSGGQGNDVLDGGEHDDHMDGGLNDDVILGASGADTLTGGDGNDTLTGGSGTDSVDAGAGNDFVSIDDADTTTGNSGIDLIDFSAFLGNVSFDMLGGSTSSAGRHTLYENAVMSAGNDAVTGTEGSNEIDGGGGGDELQGLGGADTLFGNGGNDTLFGGTGNDVLFGDDGLDTVSGGAGNDTIRLFNTFTLDVVDGGADFDTLDASGLNRNFFFVNAVTGTYGQGLISPETRTFTGIERVIGTANADTFVAAGHTITFQGGAGLDSLNLTALAGNTTLAMDTGTTQLAATLFTGFESVVMGAGNDTVTGSTGSDTIDGGGGNDSLAGGARSDTIFGGLGNDTLRGGFSDANTVFGGQGDDTIHHELGLDSLDGGAGNDTLVANGSYVGTVDLQAGTFVGAGGSFTLNWTGFEHWTNRGNGTAGGLSSHETVFGTSGGNRLDFGLLGSASNIRADGRGGADTLTGSAGNDSLSGGEGDDTLFGDDGDDSLSGDSGADLIGGGSGNDVLNPGPSGLVAGEVFDGGTGTDTLDFAALGGSYGVNLTTGVFVRTSGGGLSQVLGIENVLAGAGNDRLTGNAALNRLSGGSGNDVLNPGPSGLIAGEVFDGGTGTDTLDFAALGGSYGVNLSTGVFVRTSGGGLSQVLGIENVLAGAGNDRLTGSAALNTLSGGSGNDVLNPGPSGLVAGEVFDGGTGTDTLDFAALGGSYGVNLTTGVFVRTSGGGLSQVLGIENVLAGAGNDRLTGNAALNRLSGGAGNDVLNPGPSGLVAGEVFDGGSGTDTLDFAALGGSYGVNLTTGVFVRTSGGGLSQVLGIENVLAGSGNDRLTGNAALNRLSGGSGNDVLNPGPSGLVAGEVFDGGTGTDTLDFAALGGSYGVNLTTGAFVRTSGGGLSQVLGIENVLAGAGNDRLTGNAALNTLSGGSGNDVLNPGPSGLVAGEVFDGGTGTDTLDFAALGGSYGVNLTTGVFVRTSGGGLSQVLGIENVLAGAGNDRLTGNALANVLGGGAGNDTINGGAGNDTLTGGTGVDAFVFASALGATNIDRLTDFSVADDIIRLDDAVFAGLALNGLAPGAFAANLSGQATAAGHRILYETDTGNLFFDSDGTGAGARVQIAILASGLGLTAGDFTVF